MTAGLCVPVGMVIDLTGPTAVFPSLGGGDDDATMQAQLASFAFMALCPMDHVRIRAETGVSVSGVRAILQRSSFYS